jgi:hypothetical protein
MPDQVIDFSTLDTVEFNGTDLTKVIFNGTTIWERLIFEREFVSIGDAGNTEDNQTGFGSVIYNYSIAKTAEPLVSLKLYNADPLNASNQIDITNTRYDINDSSNNLKPIISTSFIEVCRYVNWLNIKEGEQPAYKFNGGTIEEWTSAKAWQAGGENLWRHKDAKYFIPSRNEWYKAAYSKGSSDPSAYFDYATGSNTAPTPVTSGTAANTAVWNFKSAPADVDKCGGLSRYGTIGQSGNVYEWSDFNVGIINPLVRLGQGGYWYSSTDTRMSRNYYLIHTNWVTKMTTHGIRVATADVGTGSLGKVEIIRSNMTVRPTYIAIAGDYIFYSGRDLASSPKGQDVIRRCDLDGSNDIVLYDEIQWGFIEWDDGHDYLFSIGDLFVVSIEEDTYLYWVEQDMNISDGSGVQAYRADFDGNNKEALTNTAYGRMEYIDSSYIYYRTTSKIIRTNLDGSNYTVLVNEPNSSIQSISVTGSYIYFGENISNKYVRVNLDGSNRVVLISGISVPVGLYVTDQFIYFLDSTQNKIERTDLNGNNRVVIASNPDVAGGTIITYFLRFYDGYIYWGTGTSTTSSQSIRRVFVGSD